MSEPITPKELSELENGWYCIREVGWNENLHVYVRDGKIKLFGSGTFKPVDMLFDEDMRFECRPSKLPYPLIT